MSQVIGYNTVNPKDNFYIHSFLQKSQFFMFTVLLGEISKEQSNKKQNINFCLHHLCQFPENSSGRTF